MYVTRKVLGPPKKSDLKPCKEMYTLFYIFTPHFDTLNASFQKFSPFQTHVKVCFKKLLDEQVVVSIMDGLCFV